MTWIYSLLTALLGSVAGFFGMAWTASRWVRWFRISSFEGGSAYYVLYLAILGGVVGAVVGLVASRYAVDGREAHFFTGVAYAAVAIVALLGVVYAVSWSVGDHPPRLEGRQLLVEMEIRTPPVTPLIERAGYQPGVSLFNRKRKPRGFNTDHGSTMRAEGDRRIVTTRVDLGSSDATRYLYVAWSEGCQMEFIPRIPGKPGRAAFEWSDWEDLPVVSPNGGWAASGVDLRFSVRYRVQFEPSATPPPTAAELDAKAIVKAKAAEQEGRAALAAIPADAPIAKYLEFTSHGAPASLKKEALARMRASASFDLEYAAAVKHPDGDWAATWMRLAVEFPGDRAPVVEAVRLAGEDLGRRLEQLSARPPRKDAVAKAGYDVLVRFGGFFAAAFALREAGDGDFTAELRAILLAARACQNVPGVRADIVRVSSHYLHQWAGDRPLADDPPPK